MHPLLAQHEQTAHRVLPADVMTYYSAGAGAELSVAEAEAAWSQYRLRPRVLRDVSAPDTSTIALGTDLESPIAVAPTAFHLLAHADGECATAHGAASAGSLFVLSTRSSRAIEDVAAAAGPWWFQVYVMRDHGLTRAVVERAVAAGARALVLTGDTPYVGVKYRSTAPPVTRAQILANLGEHGHADGRHEDASDQDPSVGLDAIGWLADISGLPVVVKGVLRDDDARDCVDAGARGIVVSNHGGRQTDRAVPTARALPEVAAAVGADAEVYADGGIRSGVDAEIALALGARVVFVGRPVLYGLASGGADGVAAALGALTEELADAMSVSGFRALAELGPTSVVPA